jgi:Na+/melibiose symporter-like transporter
MILIVAGYTIFFFVANLLSGMLCFIILCILGIFIFAGQGVFYLTMLVMLTNTIEYEEWQTGKNHAAIAFTVRPFMVKLSGAVQYGVVALTLILCGLYTITNSVGDVEVAIGMLNEGESLIYCLDYLKELGHDMADVSKYLALNANSPIDGLKAYASSLFMASDTSNALWGLTAVMCVAPMIMFAIAWVVLKKKYIITEELYETIVTDLANRKQVKVVD